MKKSERTRKILMVIEIVVLVLFLIAFCGCILVEVLFPTSNFSLWIKENVWDVSKALISLKSHVPVLITSLVYIIIIYAVCKILRLIFANRMKKSNRTKTVFALLDGFVKYACAIAIIIMVLRAFGVDTAALIASVGVLTLIVGLGAQPLIADIIAGIFIIFENEYNVGEIVAINDFRGTVLEIGIRSTRLLDAAGNIKIINNNSIGDVINLSRELSLAIVDCDFPYDVPVDFIENKIKDSLPAMAEKIPAIVEGPCYKGVCMYKDSNVTIKIVAKCKEEDRFQVERDMLREYRAILSENNIDIAFPQVVINYPEKKDYDSNSETKRKAQEFANEQKELSQSMDEQQM